ncbi:RHS repeat domain-containing protein [Streptomyces mirabilis]|uniref:RHS repeat domain-containing protein n=1 Tax=Streptomyces mirabilis TaxID=68239 RepID=UPI0036DDB1B4
MPPTTTQQVARQQYTPYGQPRTSANTTTWPDPTHSYLGKPQDTTTGYTDVGARKYDPTLGRFISADPLFDPTSPSNSHMRLRQHNQQHERHIRELQRLLAALCLLESVLQPRRRGHQQVPEGHAFREEDHKSSQGILEIPKQGHLHGGAKPPTGGMFTAWWQLPDRASERRGIIRGTWRASSASRFRGGWADFRFWSGCGRSILRCGER